MSVPEFTAETSVYRGQGRYRGVSGACEADYGVHPAYYVDENCLAGCLTDCGTACAGTVGQARSACIKDCARDNSDCRSTCTRPGNPPVVAGGGSATAGPCDAALMTHCGATAATCAAFYCWLRRLQGRASWCSCMMDCVQLLNFPLSIDCTSCIQPTIGC